MTYRAQKISFIGAISGIAPIGIKSCQNASHQISLHNCCTTLHATLLRNIHALLANNLLLNPAACGRLRNTAVGIGGSVYLPLEVGPLIAECFQQIGEPDPFRLRYRNQLIEVVGSIVRRCAEQSPAEIRVTAAVSGIAEEHLEHFVRVVQQELNALHEGNYARFRLRPSEFQAWQAH